MIRIGLLSAKAGTMLHVALSLVIIGVLLGGCQVPPSPGTSDAAASTLPNATEKESNANSEQVEKPVVVEKTEVTEVQSVPQKAEDARVDASPVSPRPVKQPKAVAVVEDTQNRAKPVVAAVADLPEEAPDELPIETQAAGATFPASVVKEVVERSNVSPSNAKIYVVDDVRDFGEISPLEKPTGTFHIKNIGSDILYLTRVKLCCGAQHELSSDALKPGETSVLTVTYVANAIGPFEKYLNVYSNDVNTPDVKLTIKGKVVRRLIWTPDRFKLFLDQENGGCLPVKISSIDGQPFSLNVFSATEDCLKADIDPNKVAKEFVLYPKVDLEKLKSLKIPKGVVRIGHTHPGCDVIKLNYDLFVRYAFAPKRFLVLNADQRKTRIQRLSILDNYADSLSTKNDGKDSMFGIESVRCEKGSAVLKSTKKLEDGFQLTFEITPPDPAGQRLFQDLITIVLSTGDELQVPVNGIYSMEALSVSQGQE